MPGAHSLPVPQTPSAGHAAAEDAEVLPWDVSLQDEEYVVEGGAVVAPQLASLGQGVRQRYQRLAFLPEFLADHRSLHLRTDTAPLIIFLDALSRKVLFGGRISVLIFAGECPERRGEVA